MLELERAVAGLPEGQRKVVDALLGRPVRAGALTYGQAAQLAGVHLGTLHRVLYRLRHAQPALYGHVQAVRRWQLAQRHTEALQRAGEPRRRHLAPAASRARAGGLGEPWDARWPRTYAARGDFLPADWAATASQS